MLFEELISKTENEIMRMSPLTWAYVGDSIYEVYVRTYLSNNTNLNPHKMHVESIKYVKAEAQSYLAQKLELDEEEQDIIRRGRNTENHHIPKHASHADYAYATGFEALIGYLYLLKKEDRLNNILEQSIKIVEEYINNK